MESKFKTTVFWVLFILTLFCLFIAVFSFLSRNVAGGEIYLSFSFLLAGILLILKKRRGKGIFFLVLAVIILALGAYVSSTAPQALFGEEKQVVLQYAEPIADNFFAGWNEKNYKKFTQDFHEELSAQFDETQFLQEYGTYGRYISRRDTSVSKIGEETTVVYGVEFEKKKGEVKLTFQDFDGEKVITAFSLSYFK